MLHSLISRQAFKREIGYFINTEIPFFLIFFLVYLERTNKSFKITENTQVKKWYWEYYLDF